MNREDDQKLWDLLGKSAQPELSPFFARNVSRQVRQESEARPSLLRWLRPRILAPAAVFALAAAFAGVTLQRGLQNGVSDDSPPDTVAVVDPQDYDVVVDLDDLIASEDDNLWDDDDSLSL